jgi:hypothetical protein
VVTKSKAPALATWRFAKSSVRAAPPARLAEAEADADADAGEVALGVCVELGRLQLTTKQSKPKASIVRRMGGRAPRKPAARKPTP